MARRVLNSMVILSLYSAILVSIATAADWPTFRHDAARSGVTSEKIALPLVQSWVHKSHHAPRPAWGDPKPGPVENILELRRVHFDDVFHPVAVDGAIYFGSSADHKVYCLDAATGEIRWTFITGGPVRLAPTISDGRVYVGSDDGHVYCLNAKDGAELWQKRAAPEDRRVLGHGKMISLWPLRTSIVVDDGVAYFGAGVFPAEGVFLYAVDAKTGKTIWCNDATGENPRSKIAPQGYMLASKTNLYVPMGRVSPASFDRKTGRLLHETSFGKNVGGSYALLVDDDVFTGTEEMVAYHGKSRDRFANFPGRKMVVTDDAYYLATGKDLIAMDRKDRKQRWKVPCANYDELILAGDVLIAGGDKNVVAVAAETGEVQWTGEVEGIAKGLAVADGRLLVSTDTGHVYCFATEVRTLQRRVAVAKKAPSDDTFSARAAMTILSESGVKRGYCLVLGIETGELVLELARHSDLTIYAVSDDAEKVAAARRMVDANGLLGARVCVEQSSFDAVPFSDYFANLVVSETTVMTGKKHNLPNVVELRRMLKPCGGVAMIGQPTLDLPVPRRGMRNTAIDRSTLEEWMKRTELPGGNMVAIHGGIWAKITRGPLPGAGSWTHQYANAGNTACGDDTVVKAPLGVLWFGRPGPGDMVNRHARAAAPLSLDGRLFVQGENVVMAYDAYNGVKLWRREIPGAIRTSASHDGSNLTLNRNGLFVAINDRCEQLDPATGETTATYIVNAVTGRGGAWGFVASDEDTLYGSGVVGGRQSDRLFAIDVATKKTKWVYEGVRIPHNAIAIDDGRVLLLSANVTPEQRETALTEQREIIKTLPAAQQATATAALSKADVRLVVALDAETGRELWSRPLDVTFSGSQNLSMMLHDGVLAIFGVYLDGHYWRQFFAGEFDSRRITTLSAADGKLLWSKPVGYRVRPLIIGDTLHTEPWAFDLKTGEPRTRVHPITGETGPWQFARPGHHCGLPIGSPNALYFRSLNLGYYDLNNDYGTMHFGGQRPGCWINFIPAGGLLLMPEASTGCMCDFASMGTVAFQPVKKNKAWAWYSAAGPTTPVKRLALNLGVEGDRRDIAGELWLGYPRPTGPLVLPMKIDASFYGGGGFVKGNSVYSKIGQTDAPWLYSSSARGMRKCVIPLLGPDDGKALYRVRLAFADPQSAAEDQPPVLPFDIKLQGNIVAKKYDIADKACGRNRAIVEEFRGVEVTGPLTIEFDAADAKALLSQLPSLWAVEIVREQVIEMGMSMPQWLVSDMNPKQTGAVRLTNLRSEPFDGTLEVSVPEGFTISPQKVDVNLAGGGRKEIAFDVTVSKDVTAGDYQVIAKLIRRDAAVELTRTTKVQHLGRRGRVTIRAFEDTFASNRYPDKNRGVTGTMIVDGGAQTVGDTDHALAYFKFKLEVPGTPVSVRLRLANAGNPSGDSGRVRLVAEPFDEKKLTYNNRPKLGDEVARLSRVVERQTVEVPLKVDLQGKTELWLAIDPTSCDGVDYLTREGGLPPELVIEYEMDE